MGALLRRLQSRIDYVRFVYRSEAGWAIGVAFFVLTLPIVWLPSQIVTVAVVIGIVVTVWGLARSGFSVIRLWRGAKLVESDGYAPPIVGAQWGTQTAESWLVRHASAEKTAIWWDREVNDLLRSMHGEVRSLPGRVSESRYYLPDKLQNFAGRALRFGKVTGRFRRGGRSLPIRFNGRLLRLATEPNAEQIKHGQLDFERVTYFDGECSNELWRARELRSEHAAEIRSPVHYYACDRAGSMLALENARVANIVGISVLGITTDSHAVLVRQSSGNSIAPDAWSVSGSGSLEQRDLRIMVKSQKSRRDVTQDGLVGAFSAIDLILEGMLREMREESLIKIDEIDRSSAMLTAYWRWTERAMKPEFSGLVRLNLSVADLERRRHTGGERAFSSRVLAVPVDALFHAVEQDSSKALATVLHTDSQPSTHGTVLNPSCEVTVIAARDFLRSPQGSRWIEATASHESQNT